jgi:hypothetical protein
MHEDQQHFWVVRSPFSGLEVPVLQEEVAETFRRAGWEVEEEPLASLTDEDLRCLRPGQPLRCDPSAGASGNGGSMTPPRGDAGRS